MMRLQDGKLTLDNMEKVMARYGPSSDSTGSPPSSAGTDIESSGASPSGESPPQPTKKHIRKKVTISFIEPTSVK
jgi:hypothetical protein